MYGLLKPLENASQDGKMEVRLQGTLGKDEKMEHLITFPTPSPTSVFDTDVESKSGALLHCLAAKTFIRVKQDDISGMWEIDNEKSSIISVSKSANVGSKFTSFVAVDAENHQPVPGSLKKKIVPSFGGHMMGYMAAPQYASLAIGCGFAAPVQVNAMSPQSALPAESALCGGYTKSTGGIGFFGSVKSAFSSTSKSLFGSAPPPPPPKTMSWYGGGSAFPPPPPPGGAFVPEMGAMACYGGGPPIAPPATGGAFQGKNEASSVLSLISLQKASGAWDLTDQLVSLCGKTRDALITGCPTEVAVDTAEGKLLWATALALVLLMVKFLDQKDEWEMIAEKGKKWLKKNLPGAVKYDDMLESAATAVGVQI